jgi:hypothetical protein
VEAAWAWIEVRPQRQDCRPQKETPQEDNAASLDTWERASSEHDRQSLICAYCGI